MKTYISIQRVACALWLLLAHGTALADNPALELARDKNSELHPSVREGLATIGRYADTVNRQINQLSGDGEKPRRSDTVVDPFEVSPQLRSGRRPSGAWAGLPSASKLDLLRQIQVKGMIAGPRDDGSAAYLLVRGDQTILVRHGEVVEFGDLGTFTVHVSARDGVVLSDPGHPQGNRITLR